MSALKIHTGCSYRYFKITQHVVVRNAGLRQRLLNLWIDSIFSGIIKRFLKWIRERREKGNWGRRSSSHFAEEDAKHLEKRTLLGSCLITVQLPWFINMEARGILIVCNSQSRFQGFAYLNSAHSPCYVYKLYHLLQTLAIRRVFMFIWYTQWLAAIRLHISFQSQGETLTDGLFSAPFTANKSRNS